MDHVVGAAAERAAAPAVDEVEDAAGVCDADRGVQGRRRLPGPVAHAGDARRRACRWSAAGTGTPLQVTTWRSAVMPRDLAPGAARPTSRRSGRCRCALTSSPSTTTARWRRAARASTPPTSTAADAGEAELEERRQPRELEGEPVRGEVVDHLGDVGRDVLGQQEPVVQLGAPPHQRPRVGLVPEAGHAGPAPAAPARAPCGGGAASRRRAARAGRAGPARCRG